MYSCCGSSRSAVAASSSVPLLMLLLAALPGMPHGAHAAVYCGQFDQPAAVSGFFAVVLDDGAKYAFDITMNASAFSAACPSLLSASAPVLQYHLHSTWRPAAANDTVGVLGGCGASVASGHYDPGLACGPASSYASSACASLNRTATDGYQYSCNHTSYSTRPGACETGDLSGKFGPAAVVQNGGSATTSLRVRPVSTYVTGDLLPPYAADFAAGGYASVAGWSSVVFHCDDAAGTRLFCAQLQQVASWEACAQGRLAPPPSSQITCGGGSPDSPETSSINGWSAGNYIGLLVGVALAFLILGIIVGFVIQGCRHGGSSGHSKDAVLP